MSVQILIGDCREKLREMPDASVHCCVTSPPYFGLRGVEGQMGLEPTPDEFDGTLWLNIGDSYANDGKWGGSTGGKHVSALHGDSGIGRRKLKTGLKSKDLIGIPWMLAFALRADGWYLRQEIIWHKPNPMPESVRDRCTKAHEQIFLLSKQPKYYYDAEANMKAVIRSPKLQEPGSGIKNNKSFANAVCMPVSKRNKRSVWTVTTKPFKEAHFATFPPDLIEPCILAGCPEGGVVLDPFGGAGTTGFVADRLNRNAILIELSAEYAAIAERRLNADSPLFAEVQAA